MFIKNEVENKDGKGYSHWRRVTMHNNERELRCCKSLFHVAENTIFPEINNNDIAYDIDEYVKQKKHIYGTICCLFRKRI
jgi:hypothetical protein